MRLRIAGFLAMVALVLSGCGGGSVHSIPAPIAPTVTAVTPVSSATGVAIGAAVTATFSQAMNASSFTASTFTLIPQGGSAVAGAISVSGTVATFTPTAPLAFSTPYTATITTGVSSSAGAALAANYSWIFTTAAAPPPPPTVTAVTPLNTAINIALNTTLTATFSEPMNAASFTSSTFTLIPQGGSAVAGTYSVSGSVATFTPTAALAYSTTYTATITTGVSSSSGAALAANYSWSFTTVAAPVAPMVTAVTPLSAATNVATGTTVTATFSEAMSASSITSSTFTLTPQGGSAVTGTYSVNGAVVTFTPSAALAGGTQYTALVTTGVMSSSGVALAANDSWYFTTAAAAAPTVASVSPAKNATGVSINSAITATFSEQMNSATLTGSTVTLGISGGSSVSGLITYSAGTATVTFTPSAALNYGAVYTATITTGATSSGGVALASNYSWSFTTVANPNLITVDYGSPEQTIRGFGGSTAWLGEMPPAVATALFDPVNGLGLSILRVRIDPEGSSTSTNPYETSEWDYEAANGREAVAANPGAIVFASPWTPPAAWKLNGSSTVQDDGETWNQSFNSCAEGTGYCGGYLDPNHYADYANYLEDFVKFFNTTNGFNLYAISMQNEPEENVTYESCVWTPEEMDAWVAGNASTITSDSYSTRFMMPESNSFNPVDAAAALSDSNAEGHISIVAGHIYEVLFGGSIAPYSIPAGDSTKELWMTEFGPLSTTAPTWSQALTTYAESIHNSLVIGQYNAYVWWGAFGDSTGSCATAAGTCGLVDNSGNVTVTGEVMGQYSKFIQPGYVRYDVTSPSSSVYISAYSGTESSTTHYVIVVINPGAAVSETFSIKNASVTSLTPYQSTSSAGLAQQTAITVTGGQFTYMLPAQSITTFVQ
jgi:O-glycosyl hydrolase